MLNVSKGNMYPWISHTYNPIKGRCSHECTYCYGKRWMTKPIRLEESEFKTDLGKSNFIFVGSSTDDWAAAVPDLCIYKILEYCRKFDNRYLFQTKNPARFSEYLKLLPAKSTLACTIETNRMGGVYEVSKAPNVRARAQTMVALTGRLRMISIEPVMDFDLDEFAGMIRGISPSVVSIGADSKHHNLPEPPPEKIEALIRILEGFTRVIIKDNLKRLREMPV